MSDFYNYFNDESSGELPEVLFEDISLQKRNLSKKKEDESKKKEKIG